MRNLKRRDFLKTSAVAGLAFATFSFDFKKDKPLLSYSSIACPDWPLEKILEFAVKYNYNGIELRGLERQMDLTKSRQFATKENIASTCKLLSDKKLKILCLGSSAAMHHSPGEEREKNMDEAKRYIELAHLLNCPYIRVFPNRVPKGEGRSQTISQIITALKELGNFTKNTGVKVLMESHGDLVDSDEIQKIMQSVNDPNVGLVWDVANMWNVNKEPPEQVYSKLKKYIYHTHIKDLALVDGKSRIVMVGSGNVPILDAVDTLREGGYKGYYSFEWEKLWHPEIGEPEIAIAEFAKVMKKHIRNS